MEDKMNSESIDAAPTRPANASDIRPIPPVNLAPNDASNEASPKQSVLNISSWARNLKISQPSDGGQDESPTENSAKAAFARFTSGLALRLSPKGQAPGQDDEETSSQPNIIGTLTKGLVDSSKSAVRAVQVKARHVVSQNKRRYQEDGYDLDMTYITENIIAMGFPAGDLSSGFLGYVEGFYRNHMEEVIQFLESHHKRKYKVYNLCSERLYDASLFEGKVACFPFDDHNCPPMQLIISFCQSAYSWLKEDIENVVVVHCKAGMARTGLMISSLLLFLKFFPTAEESINYYNQKRCYDGKALVLPSQIRYVKYYERILMYFNGENQPGRRCMLRGFRLHRCPYWIRPHITISDHNGVLFSTKKHPRTKDLRPEDFWFTAPKKGIMVFALPGESGLTELVGDFKVHFHDGQGDFYFWLNTTMIENRKTLNIVDMDGFDKRKLHSPGFQVEVVLIDYEVMSSPQAQPSSMIENSDESPTDPPSTTDRVSLEAPNPSNDSQTQPQMQSPGKDDVFSDDDGDESGTSRNEKNQPASVTSEETAKSSDIPSNTSTSPTPKVESSAHKVGKVSLSKGGSTQASSGNDSNSEAPHSGVSEFKAMAADASVFSFGDDEDYDSE